MSIFSIFAKIRILINRDTKENEKINKEKRSIKKLNAKKVVVEK